MCRRISWREYKPCISVGKALLQMAHQGEARYPRARAPLLASEVRYRLAVGLSWELQAAWLLISGRLMAAT
jgi:hypothetical protein